MAKALSEHWDSRRLAREAGVSLSVAHSQLREWIERLSTETSQQFQQAAPSLAEVARKARDSDICLSERIATLVEKLTLQLEHSDDIDSKDLAALQSTASKRWQHIESLTGLDVVKKIAVAKEAAKSETILSWDGVAELSVSPLVMLPAIPETTETDDLLGDLA